MSATVSSSRSIDPASLEDWLGVLRNHLDLHAREMLPVYETYAGEARFGRRVIESDLAKIRPGASVLEVGAGCMILACQLRREGYVVSALEPIGSGFPRFERLRSVVLEKATELDYVPHILNAPAERLELRDAFDYAFSVNVMEHVANVSEVIENVTRSLRPGGVYRFICPNYLFPYEPHFNIPTLFSKRLTGFLFHKYITENRRMYDPAGLWASLNWINVLQVRAVAQVLGLQVRFSKQLMVEMLERVACDPVFAVRRAHWMRVFFGGLVKLGWHRVAALVPTTLQPVIDCCLTRTGTLNPRTQPPTSPL